VNVLHGEIRSFPRAAMVLVEVVPPPQAGMVNIRSDDLAGL
jgi:hypothetical protein